MDMKYFYIFYQKIVHCHHVALQRNFYVAITLHAKNNLTNQTVTTLIQDNNRPLGW